MKAANAMAHVSGLSSVSRNILGPMISVVQDTAAAGRRLASKGSFGIAPHRWRGLCFVMLSAAGLGGCSGSAPECSEFSNSCKLNGIPPVGVLAVAMTPARLTVQAGQAAVFVANSTGTHYQWQRSTDGGHSFTDIPGANASNTLTIPAAQLPDDGSVIRVTVSDGITTAAAASTLLVSSAPPDVIQDADFQPGDWSVTALASPLQDGPTHSEDQLSSGGNADSYRSMMHTLPAGPSALQVFHSALKSTYDPATQGAIHAIDYAEDCIVESAPTPNLVVESRLLLEQAGRRYVGPASTCKAAAWTATPMSKALRAADFVLVDGAPCRVGDSCPDFAGNAASISFGYARETTLATQESGGAIVHGIDNWTVTIWRP